MRPRTREFASKLDTDMVFFQHARNSQQERSLVKNSPRLVASVGDFKFVPAADLMPRCTSLHHPALDLFEPSSHATDGICRALIMQSSLTSNLVLPPGFHARNGLIKV